ncbi:hypothetical protein [Methylobacter sp.]|uniref:hypothetical protein n=1 Tax=Methylobacter sp. TaxID=2051955 RepID=UPI0011F7E21D|nr:hypothetical protein [Methylobacter sp.]TAK59616.1 MAG: hypothetical protein EPO18_19770 [Methylobacter sp.]
MKPSTKIMAAWKFVVIASAVILPGCCKSQNGRACRRWDESNRPDSLATKPAPKPVLPDFADRFAAFSETVRGHWEIENSQHWV